jgi:hypothetical protein
LIQSRVHDVETGIRGAQWQQEHPRRDDNTEWLMIQAERKERFSPIELAQVKQQDKRAQEAGTRVLFIPTFYAIGKVP